MRNVLLVPTTVLALCLPACGSAGSNPEGAAQVALFLGDWTAAPGSAWSYECPGIAPVQDGFAGAHVAFLALAEPDIRFTVQGNGCTFDLRVSGDTASILGGQGCNANYTPAGSSAEMRVAMIATTADGKTLHYTSSSTFANGCTGSVAGTLTHD